MHNTRERNLGAPSGTFNRRVGTTHSVFKWIFALPSSILKGVMTIAVAAAMIFIGLPLAGFGSVISGASWASGIQSSVYGASTCGIFSWLQSYATLGFVPKALHCVYCGMVVGSSDAVRKCVCRNKKKVD